nr:MAG TPA: YqaJ-like viral recombinase domain protein [Caudoviricetes sp.]
MDGIKTRYVFECQHHMFLSDNTLRGKKNL